MEEFSGVEVAFLTASFAANLPEKNWASLCLDFASFISLEEKIFFKNCSLFEEVKISLIQLIDTISIPVDKLFFIFSFYNIY